MNDTGQDQTKEYSLSPFFELSHDMLCIAGFDGYFRKVNPAVCKVLGYTEEELLSEPISYFQHPDDKEITQKYREPILYGKPLTNFENRYITKNGETVWLSWTSIPVQDEELIYAIAKNVTSKKKNEEKRNQLLKDVKNANDKLKQLNYTTSHDLRSPVSNILGIAELLKSNNIKDPEALELIELLRKAGQNLKQTLNQYLDDFKQHEQLSVDINSVDLTDVLDKVTNSIDTSLDQANTHFDVDFSAFDKISFNERYMESIFLNFITNSLKYAHPNRNPEITIKTVIENNQKKLLYSDNGIGFDSDKYSDKVFGLRQTFHDNEDSKGIGLYLVHSHITSLGGQISVHSRPDEGTSFEIIFRD